jgi:hypothetical protein
MIKYNWTKTSEDHLPPSGLPVLAKVKSFGICQMVLVLEQKVHHTLSFNPSLWKKANDKYCWQQADCEFMCEMSMVTEWAYIPKENKQMLRIK